MSSPASSGRTQGTVRFKGADLLNLSRRQIVARGIARTFQNLRLFDELTTIDNVMVCLKDESGNSALSRDVPSVLDPVGAAGQDRVCAAYLTSGRARPQAQRAGAQS